MKHLPVILPLIFCVALSATVAQVCKSKETSRKTAQTLFAVPPPPTGAACTFLPDDGDTDTRSQENPDCAHLPPPKPFMVAPPPGKGGHLPTSGMGKPVEAGSASTPFVHFSDPPDINIFIKLDNGSTLPATFYNISRLYPKLGEALSLLRQTALGAQLWHKYMHSPTDAVYLAIGGNTYYASTMACQGEYVHNNKLDYAGTSKWKNDLFYNMDVSNSMGRRIHTIQIAAGVLKFEPVRKIAEILYHEIKSHIDIDPENLINSELVEHVIYGCGPMGASAYDFSHYKLTKELENARMQLDYLLYQTSLKDKGYSARPFLRVTEHEGALAIRKQLDALR